MQAIEGIYQDGHIRLLETPTEIRRSRVVVTFLDDEERNLEHQASLSNCPRNPRKDAKEKGTSCPRITRMNANRKKLVLFGDDSRYSRAKVKRLFKVKSKK